MYIVINGTEDGLHIDQITKEDLEKRVQEGWYGKFEESWPREGFDQETWPLGTWILKNVEIVVPKAVTTVTKYEIP